MYEDLSSDDLKVVRYSILFTKRDAEAVLQPEREEVVDYRTSSEAFSALKVADFLERVQQYSIPWPAAWVKPPDGGNPEAGQPLKHIPEADRKYINFVYRVISRHPRQKTEANQVQVEALRELGERSG
jgi:hypothetical protein